MSTTQQSNIPSSTVKEPKKSQAKKQPTHPKFIEMIQNGLKHLNERTGSSRVALMKYIVATYKLDEKIANTHLKIALIKGVKDGILKQVKGSGSNGSFKIAQVTKKTEVKKIVKTVKKEGTEKKQAKKTTDDKPKKNIKKIVKPKIPKSVKPQEKAKVESTQVKSTKTKTVKNITKTNNSKQTKSDVKKTTKAVNTKAKKN